MAPEAWFLMSGTVPFDPAFSASVGLPPATFTLNLYNNALRLCGNTRLAALTDKQEARFLLDDAWNDGAVQDMLEQGLWYFAKRTAKLTADPAITPNFGYRRVFQKPTDWVRTMALASDEYFNTPITQASDEGGNLYCDLQTIYFAYVSNDPQFGGAYNRWPQTFYNAVGAHLAEQIVWKLTADKEKVKLVKGEAKRLLTDARSKAAMNESSAFLPIGSWLRARLGGRVATDGGNKNSLYG